MNYYLISTLLVSSILNINKVSSLPIPIANPDVITRYHTSDGETSTQTNYDTVTTTIPVVEILISNGVTYTNTLTTLATGDQTTLNTFTSTIDDVQNAAATTSFQLIRTVPFDPFADATTESTVQTTPTTSSTVAQTTEAQTTFTTSSTVAQTTETQNTEAQTTEAQTTEAQTTEAQTTEAQTTEAQTTEAQTTEARTTKAQATSTTSSTAAQTTEAQTSIEQPTTTTSSTTPEATTPTTTYTTQETTSTTPTTTSTASSTPTTTSSTSTTSTTSSTSTTSNSSVSTSGAISTIIPSAIAYSPYTDSGSCKDYDTVQTDLKLISSKQIGEIRVYGNDCNYLTTVLPICNDLGIKVNQGFWISSAGVDSIDDAVSDLISAVSSDSNGYSWDLFNYFTIGNEAIISGYCTPAELISKISSVKSLLTAAGYTGKVTTSEPPVMFTTHPELCTSSEIDFVGVNIHSYFDVYSSADDAGSFLQGQVEITQESCPNMDVLVTETGYPSAGNQNGLNIPSVENQKIAVKSILDAFGADVTILSTYNDYWKSPGDYGIEQSFGSIQLFV